MALRILGALVYTYEWSLDQVTWSSAMSGKARYLVTGLTAGKTYYFRVSAFLRGDTMTNWVSPVSVIVT